MTDMSPCRTLMSSRHILCAHSPLAAAPSAARIRGRPCVGRRLAAISPLARSRYGAARRAASVPLDPLGDRRALAGVALEDRPAAFSSVTPG